MTLANLARAILPAAAVAGVGFAAGWAFDVMTGYYPPPHPALASPSPGDVARFLGISAAAVLAIIGILKEVIEHE